MKEELERLFKRKQLSEVTQEEMTHNIGYLNRIYDKIKELNRQNNLLKEKYQNDKKYARIHKRIIERGDISNTERAIFEALSNVKQQVDDTVLKNREILNNESYFDKMMMPKVITNFKNKKMNLTPGSSKYIRDLS